MYEKNISYNELPLLPSDKDNNSVLGNSFQYFNDSESSTRASVIRDSLLSHQTLKRNTLPPNSLKISKLSKSGPGLAEKSSIFGFRESFLTRCVVFEESDDSLDDC